MEDKFQPNRKTKQYLNNRVSKKILTLRKQLKWSQLHIATKIGMSQNNYSRIESGKSKITLDIIERICEAMEIVPVELLQ